MPKRGRGSIYKQPGCSTYTLQYFRASRRVREASGFEDFRAAQQLLTRRLAQCDAGEIVEITRKRALVDELWEGLERHYRKNARKSADCLKRRWKNLSPFFSGMPVGNVTYDLLDRYIDQRLLTGAANATVNRELAALKTAFNLGRRNQRVRVMPVFPRLAENNVRRGFVEDADFEKLTANCSELWLRLFLEIGYSYGWRKSEILKLRVGQVSFEARTIRLDPGTTKNLEGREVTMTARIHVLAIEAAAGKSKNEFLLTRDGGPVRDLRDAWQATCIGAGLGQLVCADCGHPFAGEKCECGESRRRYSGMIVHDLRRSGARQLRAAGVPESVVMKIGGWKTRSMFDRYAITSGADIRNGVSLLEQARAENALRLAAENSHDFSHDLTDPSKIGKGGERVKVN
jgi:integrase